MGKVRGNSEEGKGVGRKKDGTKCMVGGRDSGYPK